MGDRTVEACEPELRKNTKNLQRRASPAALLLDFSHC
jgi:hypothetical protein